MCRATDWRYQINEEKQSKIFNKTYGFDRNHFIEAGIVRNQFVWAVDRDLRIWKTHSHPLKASIRSVWLQSIQATRYYCWYFRASAFVCIRQSYIVAASVQLAQLYIISLCNTHTHTNTPTHTQNILHTNFYIEMSFARCLSRSILITAFFAAAISQCTWWNSLWVQLENECWLCVWTAGLWTVCWSFQWISHSLTLSPPSLLGFRIMYPNAPNVVKEGGRVLR